MEPELLREAVRRLDLAGVESPVLEAQLLLALALGVTRLEVLRGIDREPDPEERARFQALLDERARRVPLAYLRGTQEFYGLTFEVTPAVLIPRPETELLVDAVIEKLRGRAGAVLADIGTGSGCIAVASAVSLPEARVLAIDLSDEALAVARTNAIRNGVGDRVTFLRANLLDPVTSHTVDMVASNPPYIPTAEVAGLMPEVRAYEPMLALDGGPDGLAFHRGLVSGALKALRSGGWMGLEVAMGQAPGVAALLEQSGFRDVERRQDLAHIERVVLGRTAA